MRIIAGSLKGRQFDAPRGHKTHPMSDKARGGLFSVLGDIEGLRVLDAFAGSGALSFEAVSRGAAEVVAIDEDKNAVSAMKTSVSALDLERNIKIVQANASSWSDRHKLARFDLVFCDPPYDWVQPLLLQKLTRHVSEGGLFVLSWPSHIELMKFIGLEHLKTRKYGDAQLVFFTKQKPE